MWNVWPYSSWASLHLIILDNLFRLYHPHGLENNQIFFQWRSNEVLAIVLREREREMWTKIKQFVVVPVLVVAYHIHCQYGRAELKLIQLVYGDRGTCIICNCKTQQHSHMWTTDCYAVLVWVANGFWVARNRKHGAYTTALCCTRWREETKAKAKGTINEFTRTVDT